MEIQIVTGLPWREGPLADENIPVLQEYSYWVRIGSSLWKREISSSPAGKVGASKRHPRKSGVP